MVGSDNEERDEGEEKWIEEEEEEEEEEEGEDEGEDALRFLRIIIQQEV